MNIEEISLLIGLIASGLGLIASIIGWVRTAVNYIKEKKLQKLVEEKMVEAESKNLNGQEKKLYVVSQVIDLFKDYSKGMTEKVSAYIEECIDFSKKVNAKK